MKKIKLVLAIGLISAQMGAFMPPVGAEPEGNVYYVSQKSGSDYFDGSFKKPFESISKAANIMKAGDKCYIMEGVYRETVNLNIYGTENKPVTFESYEDDEVVITATERITGWERYDENIYRAKMDWDIDSGNGNMLFSDGKLCFEARWPNTTDLLDIEGYAKAEGVDKTVASITHSELPDIDYDGALVWYNTDAGYWSKLSSINGFDNVTKTITFNTSNEAITYTPKKESIFYVTRALGLVDVPGEWFKDIKDGYLYFCVDENMNPNDLCVEAKKREYALVMNNSRFVEVKGIIIRGGNILTSENTKKCIWNDLVIEGVDYNMRGGSSVNPGADAFTIYGEYNTLKNSEIKNCFGDGVIIEGKYNNVINNYIHDVNFEHTYSDGIRVMGEYQFVNHNTVTKTGRAALGGSFKKSEISYNDFCDTMRLSIDGGVIYLVNNDYESSEIHHNLIHDNMGASGYQSGIYYDSHTSNVITYNNVVWNIENGQEKARFLTINTPGINNIFFNNTFMNDSTVNFYPADGSVNGTVFMNNIFKTEPITEEIIKEKNINYSNNVVVSEDELNGDFTPVYSQNIVNKGINISGITDEVFDGYPDMGAYEYNEEIWSAGIQGGEVEDCFNLSYTVPFKNVIENMSFEEGFKEWRKENGTPELINLSAWNYSRFYTNDGIYGLMLNTGDGVSQKITGLKAYTEYVLSGFSKISGSFYQAAKADLRSKKDFISSNYKASGIVGNIKDGDWIGYSAVDFKKGEANVLRMFTNTTTVGGSISVYLDSLEGEKILEHSYRTTQEGYWNDNEYAISSDITGIHDVYFCFKGEQNNAFFGGFELYDRESDDAIEVYAISDSGNAERIEYMDKQWQENPGKISVTTGNIGEIEIFISKTGGENIGYVDGLSLTENYNQNIVNFLLDDIKILDGGFESAERLGDSSVNILEFTAMNLSDKDKEYSFTVTGHDVKDSVTGTVELSETIKANGKLSAGMGINIPETEGAYIKLVVSENGKNIDEYRITNVFCHNSSDNEGDFFVRRVWITNSVGLQKIVQEDINSVNILLTNHTSNDENVDCIIALYDAKKNLKEVKMVNGTAKVEKMNIINTEIHNDNAYLYAKIFVWQKGELKPLTDVFQI